MLKQTANGARLRHVRVFWVIAVVLPLVAREGLAFDWVKQSAPNKRIEQFVPEDLPELKFPAYYIGLDKARAQVFHGRYKLGLATLAKGKNLDAAESELVKATALHALG